MDKTFFWDFFGPHAEGTATHFRKHMDEFLKAQSLHDCKTGVENHASNHWSAWCKVSSDSSQETVVKLLKPKRSAEGHSPSQ